MFTLENYPGWVQCIVTFALGLIFAPFGYGILWLIILLVIWEVVTMIMLRCDPVYWNPEVRAVLFMSSILGWIVGRELMNMEVMHVGDIPVVSKWLRDRNKK